MAERKLPKLETGVRFPSSAPTCIGRTGVSRSPAHRTALATPPGGSRWINPGSRRGRGSIDSHPCRPRPPLGLNALVRRLHLQPREPAGALRQPSTISHCPKALAAAAILSSAVRPRTTTKPGDWASGYCLSFYAEVNLRTYVRPGRRPPATMGVATSRSKAGCYGTGSKEAYEEAAQRSSQDPSEPKNAREEGAPGGQDPGQRAQDQGEVAGRRAHQAVVRAIGASGIARALPPRSG